MSFLKHKQHVDLLEVNSLQQINQKLIESNYFFSDLYKKSKFNIGDQVMLTKSLGPFKNGHGWKPFEEVLSQNNVGIVVDFTAIVSNKEDELVKFIYLVKFPCVYYNGNCYYGSHIPDEYLSGYHSITEYSFFLEADSIKLLGHNMARLVP